MQSKLQYFVVNTLLCARIAYVLIFILFSSQVLAEDSPAIRVKDGPPPGFEDLVLPQTTEVDVYYGGDKVGNTLATYTPKSIELTFPDEVSALIPHLIDPTVITEALSGPLDTHSGAVCLSDLQRDCGVIEPNIAGVIFDESRFHLHVFINKLQLLPQGIVSNKFLPKNTDAIADSSSGTRLSRC